MRGFETSRKVFKLVENTFFTKWTIFTFVIFLEIGVCEISSFSFSSPVPQKVLPNNENDPRFNNDKFESGWNIKSKDLGYNASHEKFHFAGSEIQEQEDLEEELYDEIVDHNGENARIYKNSNKCKGRCKLSKKRYIIPLVHKKRVYRPIVWGARRRPKKYRRNKRRRPLWKWPARMRKKMKSFLKRFRFPKWPKKKRRRPKFRRYRPSKGFRPHFPKFHIRFPTPNQYEFGNNLEGDDVRPSHNENEDGTENQTDSNHDGDELDGIDGAIDGQGFSGNANYEQQQQQNYNNQDLPESNDDGFDFDKFHGFSFGNSPAQGPPLHQTTPQIISGKKRGAKRRRPIGIGIPYYVKPDDHSVQTKPLLRIPFENPQNLEGGGEKNGDLLEHHSSPNQANGPSTPPPPWHNDNNWENGFDFGSHNFPGSGDNNGHNQHDNNGPFEPNFDQPHSHEPAPQGFDSHGQSPDEHLQEHYDNGEYPPPPPHHFQEELKSPPNANEEFFNFNPPTQHSRPPHSDNPPMSNFHDESSIHHPPEFDEGPEDPPFKTPQFPTHPFSPSPPPLSQSDNYPQDPSSNFLQENPHQHHKEYEGPRQFYGQRPPPPSENNFHPPMHPKQQPPPPPPHLRPINIIRPLPPSFHPHPQPHQLINMNQHYNQAAPPPGSPGFHGQHLNKNPALIHPQQQQHQVGQTIISNNPPPPKPLNTNPTQSQFASWPSKIKNSLGNIAINFKVGHAKEHRPGPPPPHDFPGALLNLLHVPLHRHSPETIRLIVPQHKATKPELILGQPITRLDGKGLHPFSNHPDNHGPSKEASGLPPFNPFPHKEYTRPGTNERSSPHHEYGNQINETKKGSLKSFSTLPEKLEDFKPDPTHAELPKLTYDSLSQSTSDGKTVLKFIEADAVNRKGKVGKSKKRVKLS